MRVSLVAGSMLAAAWLPLAAQSTGPSPADATTAASMGTTYHGRTGQLDVAVPRVRATPAIDGRLDEAVWSGAAVLTGFSQYAPVDRLPAADSTEVLVMYTDHAIYFGIRAFEPHGAVTATVADRDRIFGNDHLDLILDTFDDRQRALVFSVNALGIQGDGTYAEGQHGTDRNPDFLFESRGRVTDFGFEVEVRIPFKSLRYREADRQHWGIQVIRRVMHSGQEQTWTPAERGASSFLEQSGRLRDLSGLRRGLVMDFNPVVTTSTTGAPRSATDPAWIYRNRDPEYGGNVRWGVTPNMSLNATVNPDFSQVESDVGQTIFDPRAAISFPEKRPFFLEANENFQVPNSLIYTRRIVAPQGAAKLSGKVGGLNVGVLSAVDDGGASTLADDPIFNIVRLRRDVGAGSNVGVVYTDRMLGDDYNRVAGVDSRLRFGGRYVLSSQVAGSFTGTNGLRQDGRPLFDFTLSATGRERGYTAIFEGVHPEFTAASGFISRAGVVRGVFQPRRTWYPRDHAMQSISFSFISDNTWEWDRFVRGTEPNDIKLNTNTTAIWRGGWSTTLYTWTETFKYPAFLYTNYRVERRDALGAVIDTVPFVGTDRLTNIGVMTRLGTPQFRRFSGAAEIIGGQDDNFDEWSSAWILYSTIEGDWRPTDKMRVNGRWLEQRVYRKSDGSLVRIRSIPRVKLEYQVSRPVFVRVVGQYDGLRVDELRDDSRSNDPILIQTATGFRRATPIDRGGLRMDWLFSYQPNPGTVFFFGYGASLGSTEFLPSDLTRTSDGFFVKLSYLLRT